VAGQLPERVLLHERAARTLAAAGDPALAAEIAGHRQAAGHPAKELTARLAAAGAAERVVGYAPAAARRHRRGRPAPGRLLPGARCARGRAAADGGGAAAVPPGSALIRSRRCPAHLRQRLPAVRRRASGQRPPVLNKALEIAEAAHATAVVPRILAAAALAAFVGGQVEDGFAALEGGTSPGLDAADQAGLQSWDVAAVLAANAAEALLA